MPAAGTPQRIPTALPRGAHLRLCGKITGNLGKTMQVWTIKLKVVGAASGHAGVVKMGEDLGVAL